MNILVTIVGLALAGQSIAYNLFNGKLHDSDELIHLPSEFTGAEALKDLKATFEKLDRYAAELQNGTSNLFAKRILENIVDAKDGFALSNPLSHELPLDLHKPSSFHFCLNKDIFSFRGQIHFHSGNVANTFVAATDTSTFMFRAKDIPVTLTLTLHDDISDKLETAISIGSVCVCEENNCILGKSIVKCVHSVDMGQLKHQHLDQQYLEQQQSAFPRIKARLLSTTYYILYNAWNAMLFHGYHTTWKSDSSKLGANIEEVWKTVLRAASSVASRDTVNALYRQELSEWKNYNMKSVLQMCETCPNKATTENCANAEAGKVVPEEKLHPHRSVHPHLVHQHTQMHSSDGLPPVYILGGLSGSLRLQ